MAFTRFHDDPHRIKKQIDESSFIGRYMLNTPGPGSDLPFIEDPHIRIQKWGANTHTNAVNLESDLRCLTRPYNRDSLLSNIHNEFNVTTNQNSYNTQSSFVEESRASHPAWTYRDLEQNRWETPFFNPLNGLEKEFKSNIQTRILEKDNYIEQIPVIANFNNINNKPYYLSGETICIGGREDSCRGTFYQK
jgi:hypothetical protein